MYGQNLLKTYQPLIKMHHKLTSFRISHSLYLKNCLNFYCMMFNIMQKLNKC